MSADAMMAFLSTCSIDVKVDFRIVTQCAPVLKGIKASNLITVKKGMCEQVQKRLRGSRISCVMLYQGEEKEVLFLYRLDLLFGHLQKKEVAGFLEQYGYFEETVAGVISRLRHRYQQYIEKKMEFPHELGVLLEYPIKDVQGFIENQGKNCLAEKYWKVYHNKDCAEKLFRMYDQAKEKAMKEIVDGYPLHKVAVS